VIRPKTTAAACAASLSALVLGACGEQKVVTKEANNTPVHQGAVLFNERCSGCHTLGAAAARGSTPQGEVKDKERTDGPNLDFRRENMQSVLFAIRNGGFSGAIMPANIVVGGQAQQVAQFVAKYAGSKAQGTGPVQESGPTGVSGNGAQGAGGTSPTGSGSGANGPSSQGPTTP
jgi:mono/diheme cytochrome c family protein